VFTFKTRELESLQIHKHIIKLFAGREGNWVWFHSNENLTDNFWGPNSPNTNPGNSDDCGALVVRPDNFWWEDTDCVTTEVQHKEVAIICQHDLDIASTTTNPDTTTTEETICPSGWIEFESHCYQFRPNSQNWSRAHSDCMDAGGNLASVHSQAENDFISDLCGSQSIWLGSSDEASEVNKDWI
jgi:hypothetical protein